MFLHICFGKAFCPFLLEEGTCCRAELDKNTKKKRKKSYNVCFCFFLSECCMAQRRSLSGRSPFCQRKQSDSRNFTGSLFFHESNKLVTKHETKTPTTMQSPRECGGGGVWPVPRTVRSRASWQRREHACQPSEGEGAVCSIGWKMLQVLRVEQ